MTQKPFRTYRQVTKVKAINDNTFDNGPTTAIWLASQNMLCYGYKRLAK